MANIVERVGEMLKQLSPLDQRVEALVSQLTLKEKVALLSGLDIWRTVPIERAGIPSITMTDGPHGVRASRHEANRPVGPTTAFPTGVSMASTWNPERLDPPETVRIQTTTGDVQAYERFGRIHFEVDGQPASLTLFRNEHGYFLPFADRLAGSETYGAGRYLEPEELPDGRPAVDFNLAYNPYCAYNERGSCPITPAENRLGIPIRAGEQVFHSGVP